MDRFGESVKSNGRTNRASKAKRHHQVPRFYLARFANPKAQVVAYRRADATSRTLSVTNAAVENGFYDIEDETGARSTAIEEALAEIEGLAKTVIERIAFDTAPPSEDERVVLSFYMALQTTRTKEFRQSFKESGDVLARLLIDLNLDGKSREQVRTYMREMTEEEPTDEDMDALMGFQQNIENNRIFPNQNKSMEMMLEIAFALAPFIHDRSWLLLKSDKRSFLTSDRLLVLWKERTDANRHYGVGIDTATEIHFPLDPWAALVLGVGSTGGWDVMIPEPARIKHINAQVAHWSHEWIYHNPKHDPLKGVWVAPEGPLMHINNIPVRSGTNVWNELRGQFLDGTAVPIIHVGNGVDSSRRG